MRITQWGEYGIHFSAYMARQLREGNPIVGASEIAKTQGVDIQYAQQILQRLRRGGIIDSVRGPTGGYRLCKPTSEVTLKDILEAAEGETFAVICDTKPINAERCALGNPCGLRDLWKDLKSHIDSFMAKHTLEELSKLPAYTFAETSPLLKENLVHKIGSHPV